MNHIEEEMRNVNLRRKDKDQFKTKSVEFPYKVFSTFCKYRTNSVLIPSPHGMIRKEIRSEVKW